MKCPVDGTQLVMSERHGIEIDYCPQCRGVWLDRGELDKIIERSLDLRTGEGDDDDLRYESRSAAPPPPPPPPPPRYERDRDDDYRYKRKKKRSFLEDIFDFD